MKCIDVVKTVLDETYSEVPGNTAARDASIQSALTAMAERYETVMAHGGPDFNHAATRFGYVYQHVPANAYFLYSLLEKCDEAEAILKNDKVRVTCIGGGPGSEVVGLLKFLDGNDLDCKLFCELIDGCEAWKATWDDLAYLLDLDSSLSTTYVIHDVANKATWSSHSRISKADIIVLNFFVSEIFHLPFAEEYLTRMLSAAKGGAVLLVNDNRTQAVYELVEKIAKVCGFKMLVKGQGVEKMWDAGEDKAKLKVYMDKFGRQIKLTHNLFWRAFEKPT
jgi:hypothetical protein